MVRQQQHGAQQPAPDGTFAWGVLGTNDYRVVKQRFHDVNEPTEPQWSFSLFKNTARREQLSSGWRRSTSSTCGSTADRTPIPTANFGIVDTASQVNFPRTIQLGVKFQF